MTKQEEIREAIRDILTRFGNFMDGYDADGDELDIDEALKAILSITQLPKDKPPLLNDKEITRACVLEAIKYPNSLGAPIFMEDEQ